MSEPRIFHYLVTVELRPNARLYGGGVYAAVNGETIQNELDSNLESCIYDYGIEHFTVEPCDVLDRNVPLLDYRERIIRSHES